jgi:uncharacterized repeat protein (TIGR04138 family)
LGEGVDWLRLSRGSGPYPVKAYQFVSAGLSHTARVVHKELAVGDVDSSRHISGQQLCLGLRDYAIRQYGMLARTVLAHWHIQSTSDFGKIVFAMIDAGLMRKTDSDSIEDFDGVFDFDEAFEQ